jgi:hypothetical protein
MTDAGTAHPLEQMRASSNQIIVFTQLEIYKLQSVVSCNYTPAPRVTKYQISAINSC